MNDAGYSTAGVSANPFAGPMTGFDRQFDEFHYTLIPQNQDGVDIKRLIQDTPSADSKLGFVYKSLSILRAVASHENPIASSYNVARRLINILTDTFPFLHHVPHPLFHPFTAYSYSPESNTTRIRDIIAEQATEAPPFFIFTNYMDTHRPYYPSAQYQRAVLGRELRYAEIKHLNSETANPQGFTEAVANGTVDEDDVETLRKLYTATVMEVDDHIRDLISELDTQGIRDQTLVVVTADHGEDLGEDTPWGRYMGHMGSVSDNLLRVPLLVIHPSLSGDVVSQYTSLKDLFTLFTELPTDDELTNQTVIESLVQEDTVLTECPATHNSWHDDHPDVPQRIFDRQTTEQTAVAYREGYKTAICTDGSELFWQRGETVTEQQIPATLIDACRESLQALVDADRENETRRADVDDNIESQLEDLGYF
jgi:arylsulfatase A-like enzyme